MSELLIADLAPSGRTAYRRLVGRRLLLIGGLASLLLASIVADLTLGPARYGYGDVLRALLGLDVPMAVSWSPRSGCRWR